jgi:hypothetical protein
MRGSIFVCLLLGCQPDKVLGASCLRWMEAGVCHGVTRYHHLGGGWPSHSLVGVVARLRGAEVDSAPMATVLSIVGT